MVAEIAMKREYMPAFSLYSRYKFTIRLLHVMDAFAALLYICACVLTQGIKGILRTDVVHFETLTS